MFTGKQWSDTVEDYYPIQPSPRWGYGRPPNPHLKQALESGRSRYRMSLLEIGEFRSVFHEVEHESNQPLRPRWNNHWFSVLDAVSLMGFVLSRKPKRYVEIGSGNSTLFARFAIDSGQLPTKVMSIDPEPRRDVDKLCDELVRTPLEECNVELFACLRRGDILFFDGSHRVFTNSDVTALFLDILPTLPEGVLIHLHDIFLPDDYPSAWNVRLYSEQYLLGAMLLCADPPFRVVLPNYFVCNDPDLSAMVKLTLSSPDGVKADIPFFYYNDDKGFPGVSFWIETASH
jgi:hypothetical protein